MLAYRVTEENLPLISTFNDGVIPLIEDEVRYFVASPGIYNVIVTESEFKEKYQILIRINEVLGRYTVMPV